MSQIKALTLAALVAFVLLGGALVAIGIGHAHPGHVTRFTHNAVYHQVTAPIRNI